MYTVIKKKRKGRFAGHQVSLNYKSKPSKSTNCSRSVVLFHIKNPPLAISGSRRWEIYLKGWKSRNSQVHDYRPT
jgi:hypothetical protein